MKIIGKRSLVWSTGCLLVITILAAVLWNHNPYPVAALLWNHSPYTISTVCTSISYDSYPKNICGQNQKVHEYNGNVSSEEHGTYILTASFVGQQGGGCLGLLSQQCFSNHLSIPVSIVEPFLMNTKLGHVNFQPYQHQTNLIKFSDLFNIHTFNAVSKQSGYRRLATWEEFLSNAQEKTILVELQSGEQMQTNTLWEADIASRMSCYNGTEYASFKELATCSVCIVRVVTVCCIDSQESSNKSALTINELKNALFGSWKPEEVNLLFTYWSAYWHVPSESCKEAFHPFGNLYSSHQLVKHASEYRDLYVKSNQSTVAFVLWFEYLLAEHYDIDACMKKVYETYSPMKTTDTSVFVAADVGKYASSSWKTSLSGYSSNQSTQDQLMETFKNAVSLLIGDHWTFEDWENSFSTVTAGIEDNGYIAALQKAIASQADCIYFLVLGGNFQYLVVEEYVKHHPR